MWPSFTTSATLGDFRPRFNLKIILAYKRLVNRHNYLRNGTLGLRQLRYMPRYSGHGLMCPVEGAAGEYGGEAAIETRGWRQFQEQKQANERISILRSSFKNTEPR